MRALTGLLEITVIIIGVVLYFNAGWSLYSWYENNEFVFESEDISVVKSYEDKSALEKTLTGPEWLNNTNKTFSSSDRIFARIVMIFLWPFVIAFIGLTWLAHGIMLFFWLTFLGGLAKILGIG